MSEKLSEETAKKKIVRKKKSSKKITNERQTKPTENTISTDLNPYLLFEKYDYDVEVRDLSLKNYINLKPLTYPSTFRMDSKKMFSKGKINIVERLINSIMRGGTGRRVGGHVIRTEGRLQGKKLKVMHIVVEAFETINRKTSQNPLQIFIMAIENSAPIEDTTRIRQGGTISTIPVDISASRRLDVSLKNIAIASIVGAFKRRKKISDVLADEIIMASKNDINSYAIKIKNEKDRMARSAR